MAFGKWTNGVLGFADGQNSVSDINTSLGAVCVPIGCVIGWAKSITGTPALSSYWVECNGQTLSDAESPFNGQVIPNLNANLFLRGNTTSGGTGGNLTHTHTTNLSTNTSTSPTSAYPYGGLGQVVVDHSHYNTSTSVSANNTPTYTNVVWIFRIK
ncbi:Uncharacterised protein [Candidatus Anstonella stagnisolia]|nr:Uncharacterised protein [Candidatus Anstonella stagnisolia]